MAKRKKLMLKIGIGILLVPIFLFLLAVAVVSVKQQAIVQKVLQEFNETIPGKITLEKSRISPFATFPYVSIDLKGVQIFETKTDTIPVLSLHDVYVGFDVMKIIKGDIEIKKIKLNGGNINIIAYQDGNYNITNAFDDGTESSKDTTETQLALNLKSFSIKNVYISKKSEIDSAYYSMLFEKFKTSLRKNDDEVLAKLKGEVFLSLKIKDSVLAKEKSIALSTEARLDKANNILTLNPSELRIANIRFTMMGSADLNEDVNVDFEIFGEKDDFSLLLAFLPDEYAEFMKRYENAGKIFFKSTIKGPVINGNIPLIEAEFGCENGFFNNTFVNRRLDDFSFNAFFTNGEKRNLTTSKFVLKDLNAQPDQGAVKAKITIIDFTDPYVDLKIFTDFDLQFLADFLQLSYLRNITGKVTLDVNYNELVDLNRSDVALTGFKKGVDSRLIVQNLNFRAPGYPFHFENINLDAEMEEGRLTLKNFNINLGKSDLALSGYVSDLPAILHNVDKEVELKLNIKSSLLDLYALTSFDTTRVKPVKEKIKNLSTSFKFRGKVENLKNFDYLPKGEYIIDDLYAKLKYYPHTLHNFDVHLVIQDNDFLLKKFHGEIDNSDFDVSLKVENYPKWLQEKKKGNSKVLFDISSRNLYPSNLLTYNGQNFVPEDYLNENVKDLKLKGYVRLNYLYDELDSFDIFFQDVAARLTLHPMKLEQLKGRVHGKNGVLSTQNLFVKIGNTDAKLNMTYHYSKEKKHRQNYFILKSNFLDFDQLTDYEKTSAKTSKDIEAHQEAFNIFDLPFSNTKIQFDIGRVKYHRIDLTNFKGKIRLSKDKTIHIDTLDMDVVGGKIKLRGYLDGSNPDEIYFSPNFIVQNLDLNEVMIKADNFGQEYVLNDNIKGILSGKITGKIRLYPDLYPILQKSELDIDVMLKDGVFVNFAPLRAMSSYFGDRNLNYVRFDTLQNVFTFKNNEMNIPQMVINSSLGFLEFSGRQNMDMSMEYLVRVPWSMVTNVAAQKLFGGRNKAEVPEDRIDEIVRREDGRRVRFVNVRITGTPDNYRISLVRNRNSI